MKVKDIMISHPMFCSPLNNLKEVAQMMQERNCGEITVIENIKNLKPIGFITDNDIVCRAVAFGKDPSEMAAAECMSTPCVTVSTETAVEDCRRILKDGQIRLISVIDEQGRCCGIVSRADLVTHHLQDEICEV